MPGDPEDVVDATAHELRDSMGFGADSAGSGRRVDTLDPGDPLRVVMRVEHVGGDLFRRPGNVGLHADIERHGSSCFSRGYSNGVDVLVQVRAKIIVVDAITVIAAPRRREILRLIWDRELSAGDIAAALPVTFGAVSQHLSVLRDAGIVDVRQEGTYRFYRANQERIGPLAAVLEAYWSDVLDRLAAEAEREEPTTT